MSTLLRPGKKHKDVLILKSILRSQGYFITDNSDVYDKNTEDAVYTFQSQHIDQNGEYLKVDGVVGPKTWWALNNPVGSLQYSGLTGGTVKGGLSAVRRAVLRVAEAQHRLGVREIPDGSNRGDGVDKFIVGYGAVPWCALAVSWIVKEATGKYPLGKREAGVLRMWNRAKEQGKAHALSTKRVPIPGDLMVMLYRYTSGPNKGKLTGSGHVSIVAAVSEDAKAFNTYGGNEGNRFKLGLRYMTQSSLEGFINLFGDDSPNFTRGLLTTSSVAGDSTR